MIWILIVDRIFQFRVMNDGPKRVYTINLIKYIILNLCEDCFIDQAKRKYDRFRN